MDEGFSSSQLQQIHDVIVKKLQELTEVIASDADAIVELDQSSVGRLSRMDAMQHQAVAKAQLQKARQDIQMYHRVLDRIVQYPDDFGFCFDCDEMIAFKRLLLKPESLKCIPCLEKDSVP